MFNIVICEDNENQRKQVEKIINEELINLEIDSKIELSSNSPETVINYIKTNKTKSFLYFLDVALGTEMNGIELANAIRKYDSKGYIVFITSHSELSLLTFQYKVQALDYIIKSDTNSLRGKISDCITAANNDFENVSSAEKESLTINFGNRITKFALDEILFFETTEIDHKLRIHTNEGHFEFYGTLKEIEAQVSEDFFKTHRSYLVNTNKVKSIDKENHIVNMINNETCYISARYLKGLIKRCVM